MAARQANRSGSLRRRLASNGSTPLRAADAARFDPYAAAVYLVHTASPAYTTDPRTHARRGERVYNRQPYALERPSVFPGGPVTSQAQARCASWWACACHVTSTGPVCLLVGLCL
ncbi:hypothetical protein MRX96_038955 [Rhipicephalus microplus]